MAEGPDFLTSDTTEDVVIRTTFDPEMQAPPRPRSPMSSPSQVRDGSEAQAAIVVMSADGAVRAMVGGRDTQGAGPVQPRDPGDAADRLGLQALRLCHRARPGLALR
jgi:hypothetical protein